MPQEWGQNGEWGLRYHAAHQHSMPQQGGLGESSLGSPSAGSQYPRHSPAARPSCQRRCWHLQQAGQGRAGRGGAGRGGAGRGGAGRSGMCRPTFKWQHIHGPTSLVAGLTSTWRCREHGSGWLAGWPAGQGRSKRAGAGSAGNHGAPISVTTASSSPCDTTAPARTCGSGSGDGGDGE